MTRIGTSELDVLPICLGANVFGWTASQEVSFEILDAFVDGGGSFVDTADAYSAFAPGNEGGESETVIGNWIADRGSRDKLVLATKVSRHPKRMGLGADNIAQACRESLERLQTEVIDLYWAHFDDEETPLEESIGAFGELLSAGSVRYLGLSNYSPARITEWLETSARLGVDAPVALQPHYNLMVREPVESELAPLAEEHGLGVVPYFALASGFLTGKYRSAEDAEGVPRGQMLGDYLTPEGFAVADALRSIAAAHGAEPATIALAWLAEQPTVVAPIASASKLSHLGPLLESVTCELTAEERARLEQASDAFAAA